MDYPYTQPRFCFKRPKSARDIRVAAWQGGPLHKRGEGAVWLTGRTGCAPFLDIDDDECDDRRAFGCGFGGQGL